MVVARGGGAIFTRYRHVAQTLYRIAVGGIQLTRLLVEALRLRQIIGFQRRIAFADQRPVQFPGLRFIRLSFGLFRLRKEHRIRQLFLLLGQQRTRAVRRFTAGEN